MTNLKSKIVLIAGMLLSALFATGDDLSGIRVEVVAGTPLRVNATFEAAGSARTLYVVYGDEDCGLYNWPHQAELCAVSAGASSVSSVALPDVIGTRYSRFRLTFAPLTKSSDYLQENLVAQWDAIDNAGRGTNDSSAVEWQDLIGGRNISSTGLTFDGSTVVCPAGVTPVVDLSELQLAGKVKTVEIVCRADSGFVTSGKSAYVFRLCNDLRLTLRTDISTYVMPVYNRFSDSRSFWANTSSSDYNTKNRTITHTSYSLYNAGDPGDSSLYADGVRLGANGWYYDEAGIQQNQNLTFGHANAKFYISSIRIYNRALTADERMANYGVDVARYLTSYASSGCQTVNVPFSATCYKGESGIMADLVFMPTNINRRLFIAYGKDEGSSIDAWKHVQTLRDVSPGLCTIEGIEIPPVALASSGFRFFLIDSMRSSDYLQSDLVAQWDAIDNAGRNMHDAAAIVWKDLVGTADIPVTGLTFEKDRIVCPAGVTASVGMSALRGQIKTVEIVCRADDAFASSGKAATVFDLCNDVQLGFRNDASGCYIQPHFRRVSDDCVFWFWPTSDGKFNTVGQPIRYDSYSLYNAKDPGDSNFYVEAEKVASRGWYYNEVQTQKDLLTIGHANAKFYISSIRIYSRDLTADERASNYAVDKSRYLGAAVVVATEYVKIPHGLMLIVR